jgi:hypothetical protein
MSLAFDVRKRLEQLTLDINILNSEKAAVERAWQGEKERLNDPEMERPEELKTLNRRLGPLYGEKEDLLRDHPQFEADFGGKKKSAFKESPLGSSPNKRLNADKKKAKYLANREERRNANRTNRNNKGQGKKAK